MEMLRTRDEKKHEVRQQVLEVVETYSRTHDGAPIKGAYMHEVFDTILTGMKRPAQDVDFHDIKLALGYLHSQGKVRVTHLNSEQLYRDPWDGRGDHRVRAMLA